MLLIVAAFAWKGELFQMPHVLSGLLPVSPSPVHIYIYINLYTYIARRRAVV